MTGERLPQPERKLTIAQAATLAGLCLRYEVDYDPNHYYIHPADDWMMPGWAEGFIGGYDIQETHPTIFIGCGPDGRSHS